MDHEINLKANGGDSLQWEKINFLPYSQLKTALYYYFNIESKAIYFPSNPGSGNQ